MRAWLESEITLVAGQFVLARVTPSCDPYLRRPLFPVKIGPNGFAIELSAADPFSLLLQHGETISILGPLGRMFSILPQSANLLLVGRSQPHFLLPLAAQALERAGAVTLLLSQPYPVEALDPQIEVRLGELSQMLDDSLGWADNVVIQSHAVLPAGLRKQVQHSASKAYALISPPMPCGTGACQACAIYSGDGWRLACTDGPTFELDDLKPAHE